MERSKNHGFNDLVQQGFGMALELSGGQSPVEIQSGSHFFRLSLDPIIAHGEETGSIFIVAETTKQKLAEEALLISERLAATGRMAHTIAHEINSPLEAITNLLYLLPGSIDRPEIAHEYIKSATSELSRVSRISRQILSFNRGNVIAG